MISLSPQQAQHILRSASLPDVTLIKQHNHIFRLTTSDERFFLKTYTKDWYGDDAAATEFCVEHEDIAWKVLAKAGLAVPEVVAAEMMCDNVLSRPFIVTRALEGEALTTLVEQPAERDALLVRVGDYLRAMHAITFPFPGYIRKIMMPPRPDEWQHPIWTFEQFERDLEGTWLQDLSQIDSGLASQIAAFYVEHRDSLAEAYEQPRFTHGDCHASQFFLRRDGSDWKVTGVVDMEVASAGDCGADLLKFSIEMASVLPADTRWWEPLFEGYGATPSFSLMKLRMLAAGHDNYLSLWNGTRSEISQHIIDAHSWEKLFDVKSLQP